LPLGQPIIFTQATRAELIAAQDWYETQAQGLGRRFRANVDSAAQRIESNPRLSPVVFTGGVRRALVRDFPYGLFYVIDQDAVTVIACFHASRDPLQWQRRG
jgi:plasmid stabilization system protein ParE